MSTPEAAAKAAEAARREAARQANPSHRNGLSLLIGIAAIVVSICAGGYLLLSESASEESTVFDVLMDGIGAYFIARGLWWVQSLTR